MEEIKANKASGRGYEIDYITSQQSLDSLAPSPDADQEELVFNVKGIQAAAAFNLVHLEVCLLITRNISD